MSNEIPAKLDHLELEKKWRKIWDETKIFAWDPSKSREETFVVDTPPPTVSGSLHMGHVFSYTQTDVVTRYQRMCGKNIFYPIGWDDNGLATERRVQNFFGIRCDPRKPYQADWKPEQTKDDKKQQEEISRRNFIEACAILTHEDEKAFRDLWQHLSLSVDWSTEYATINDHCRRISQLSFLDLIKKGLCYNVYAPTVWDVDFKSAISQAEIEDKEIPGAYHSVKFGVDGGGDFTIMTTRPELIPACIAIVAHPDDERYKPLFGKFAITPLFQARVPIVAAPHADPEKGTGILMVCTFGDVMDFEWWKKSGLPMRQIIDLSGNLKSLQFGESPFDSKNPELANQNYSQLIGLSVKKAQRKIVELLAAPGSGLDGTSAALIGEPKPITHPVKFYEKGDRPLEIVPTRQWFVKILDLKDQLLAQGRKIAWHPEYMRARYENWVEGLNQDWCISRQRFFGVPFPVWYPLDAQGTPDYKHPLYPEASQLPVDPMSQVPQGYREDQRDKPNGFSGDPDVMDTWATSSLTPQIASKWTTDPSRHKKLFPMDIRPQSHEIIRTWAFYTIVKAWLHEKEIPWKNVMISGWILDPDRKKMSKSKGNVVTPQSLLAEHSADAVRYWSARARLGVDTAFDPKLFTIGRKLTTKLFNASRFLLMQMERVGAKVTDFNPTQIAEPLDCALVAKLKTLITEATNNFNNFEYAAALQASEDAFWEFCDHYLELVKVRSYSEQDTPARRSALATLSWSLKTFLRLFAPVIPYMTEEVWSWSFVAGGRDRSVHTTAWPTISEVKTVPAPSHELSYRAAIEVTGKIRGTKTDAQKNLRWPVSSLIISGSDAHLAALKPMLSDVLAAGNVVESGLKLNPGANPEGSLFEIQVVLGEQEK